MTLAAYEDVVGRYKPVIGFGVHAGVRRRTHFPILRAGLAAPGG
jgi:hypothetical protein